jgi:ParB family transcriptional regulator, chromosome partitioning protein
VARQSGLGKGLGALLPSAMTTDEPTSSVPTVGQLADIAIADVRPNTFQPRSTFDDEGIAALAASIREVGVLQPILVRALDGGGYELIAGERRWRAARRAGLTLIPSVIKAADDHGSLEQALVENLHRADLNALEEAAAFQQLIDDFGMTHEQVADRVGKSRTAVSNTLRLMQLSPAIQRLVLDGQLSAGHARALLGTTDKSFQEALARRVTSGDLSVRATEEAVRLRLDPRSGSSPKVAKKGAQNGPTANAERPAGLLELEHVLEGSLDTKVAIEFVPGRKGRMVIEFADLNDLERIFRIMTGGSKPH